MSSSSKWPPVLSPEQESNLLTLAADYSLSHGLVYRPPVATLNSTPSQTSAIHAPYSLFPCPFPKRLFQQALELQPAYNHLYADITVRDPFLDQVVGGAVSKVDEFQKGLYQIWQTCKKEGIKQPLHLGLFRSDYLIHCSAGTSLNDAAIKQVEFNTISASFGCLSSRVTDMHRYLLQTGSYPKAENFSLENLPENKALHGLAAGLAAGHDAYENPDAQILMIIQDNERNAFDQRPLEYELLQTHNIKLLRIPFSELHTRLSIRSTDSALVLADSPTSPDGAIEISVVYWRCAYTPDDFPDQGAWGTRLLIERSRAIKCPTIALQLAGCKKMQQVLAEPNKLEQFSLGLKSEQGDEARRVRESLKDSFMGLWPMDDSELGQQAEKLARTESEKFVLKPQREGGGNNIYREAIPPFLDRLAAHDSQRNDSTEPKAKEGYILMELISPPEDSESVMVRAGAAEGIRGQVVSELGIYGVCLFKQGEQGQVDVLLNQQCGHLLRTKGRESDEGGVAVGFSVIDSPWLV